MMRRALLSLLPASLVPTAWIAQPEDKPAGRRLERLSRETDKPPETNKMVGLSRPAHCYEVMPLAMTTCDYPVKAGDPVYQLCEGRPRLIGRAWADADALKPFIVVVEVDINA